jgi:hypothetical protein
MRYPPHASAWTEKLGVTCLFGRASKLVGYRDEVIESIKGRLDEPDLLSREDIDHIHCVLISLVEKGANDDRMDIGRTGSEGVNRRG